MLRHGCVDTGGRVRIERVEAKKDSSQQNPKRNKRRLCKPITHPRHPRHPRHRHDVI